MTTANSYLYGGAAAGWSRQRVLTVIAVIALHLACLVLVISVSHSPRHSAVTAAQPFGLIYVATATLPKQKAAASDLPRLDSISAISVRLPNVDSPTLPSTAFDSQGRIASDGVGAGIDWAAEARRELQAHEIRQNAPPDENHMAGRPPEESWWPRAAHQKGDRYKTNSGDWVVWITSNCYQVATAMPRSIGPGPAMPQTYCFADPHSPESETIGGVAVGVSSQN